MATPPRRWVGYALLITGLLLLFDTETFLRTNWSPLHVSMSVPTELAVAYLLSASGIIAFLAPSLMRIVGSFAPDASVKVAQAFPHQSVEVRLRRRLPLQRKFSALPNRALVGGATILLLLIPAFLMVTQQTPAKGIYVHLTPQLHRGPNENCLEGPIVIRLTGQNEKSRMLVNGKELRREELEPFLKAALARRANWEVFIEGDDSVSYADPMYAIDVINALHAKAVILTPKLKGQIGDNCR
ncbi:MAG TPA: biopolymer transporter ExbD [Terriglobales bacterium]|jgi:biopolymer transport protein ExbD|nr:biopolymer transporter ExbD [Terriglobales bacterium]